MARTPSHSFVDHTAEVELQLWAATMPELLVEAGRGVADLMLGDLARPPTDVEIEVAVEGHDRETLLVSWIDELVFQCETQKAVFTEFAVRETGHLRVAATLHGIAEPPVKTAVKAATFHGLQVLESDGGLAASIILDV